MYRTKDDKNIDLAAEMNNNLDESVVKKSVAMDKTATALDMLAIAADIFDEIGDKAESELITRFIEKTTVE